MDIDGVADELYSLAPEKFTATRNDREKEAKAAGEPDLAAEIRQLEKPSAAAWLANQLVREHPDELQSLLELGDSLREATENLSGDQLRELGKQQHRIVYALVQQAKRLASGSGRKVSDDTARGLQDTLHAALADATAAEQLLAGRLTGTLSRSGFGLDTDGDGDGDSATGGGTPKPAARRTAKSAPARKSGSAGSADPDDAAAKRRAAQLESAKEDEAAARAAADEAAERQQRAQDESTAAERAVTDATAEVDRLREELDQATKTLSGVERDQRRARSQAEKADRTKRDADRRVKDAAARTKRLTG